MRFGILRQAIGNITGVFKDCGAFVSRTRQPKKRPFLSGVEEESKTILRNVDSYLRIDTAQHHRTLQAL
jgi:hypothetical protein